MRASRVALALTVVLALGSVAQAGVEIFVGGSGGLVQVFDGTGAHNGVFISSANGAGSVYTLTPGPDGKAYLGTSVSAADDIYAKPVSQIDGAAPSPWNTSSPQYNMSDGVWDSSNMFYQTARVYSGGYYDGVTRYNADGSAAGNGTDPQPLWLRDDPNLGGLDYPTYDYSVTPCAPTTKTFAGAAASATIATVDIAGTPTELLYVAHRYDNQYADHDNADGDCSNSTGREHYDGGKNGMIYRYKLDGTPYGAGGNTSDPLLLDMNTLGSHSLHSAIRDIEVIDGKLYVLIYSNGAGGNGVFRYDAVSGAVAGETSDPSDPVVWISTDADARGPNGEYWASYSQAMAQGPDGNLYVLARGYNPGNAYHIVAVGDDGTGEIGTVGAKDGNGYLIAPIVTLATLPDEASGQMTSATDLFVRVPEPATLGLLGLGGLGLLLRRRRS